MTTPTIADLAIFAKWMDAEGSTLAEFVDVLERPDRWESEIAAARALHDAMPEGAES